jgi:hypothetical protein
MLEDRESHGRVTGKRVKPEVGTGTVGVVGSLLLATKKVAAEELKNAEWRMKNAADYGTTGLRDY